MNSKPLIKKYGRGRPIVTIVACVHGDETCGLTVEKLLKENNLNNAVYFIIANPPAIKAKRRFVESNLNRVFPGKLNGTIEEQLAYRISPILKKSDFVLDIHSSSEHTPAFVITTMDSEKHRKLANNLGVKKYVIMAKEVTNKKSLIDYVNQNRGLGISVECGQHKENKTQENAITITKNFLNSINLLNGKTKNSKLTIYRIEGSLKVPSSDFVPVKLKNFRLVRAKQLLGKGRNYEMRATKDFYPLLFSSRLIDNKICLIGRKLN